MNFNNKNEKIDIYPLFGDLLKGEPYVFDFSSKKTLLSFSPNNSEVLA